ncbi:MAG: heme o synthase [Solirubrobacterales bacterium]|jgi:heme A synthase|nr:heme o synthase [Solirubrobacterales bacterium]
MDSVAARGDADELSRFRRLVTFTIAATLALILIGGVVRVSDSGLGCGAEGSGTHGWPLCEGGLLPAGTSHSVVEFSHRMAATIVVILIGLMLFRAFRRLRDRPLLVRGTVAAAVLVIGQAALGGLTVEKGLEDELVAAHLGLAMLLLGLLFVLRRGAETTPAPAPETVRGLRPLSFITAALVLATIVAGGYVAGTEYHGTGGEPYGGGAHAACGLGWSTDQFPGCNGQGPLSFGQSRLADIQLTHRLLIYLTTISVIAMAALALRRRAPSRAFWIAPLILVGQIALGAINIWAGEHAALIVGHLALGTTLWATVVYATATLLPASAPARERLVQPDAGEAVPA